MKKLGIASNALRRAFNSGSTSFSFSLLDGDDITTFRNLRFYRETLNNSEQSQLFSASFTGLQTLCRFHYNAKLCVSKEKVLASR